MHLLGNVRFGSKADIMALQINVHFTPKTRHWLSALGCPLCANSRHRAASTRSLCRRGRGAQVDR